MTAVGSAAVAVGAVVAMEEDTGGAAVAEDDARCAQPRAAPLAATTSRPARRIQGVRRSGVRNGSR
jgi:hypothetical protein